MVQAGREDLLTFEKYFRARKFISIAGVDEVGRGPLAGPVVAACVILPPSFSSSRIRDSKQLSPAKRGKVYWEIISIARVGIGIVSEKIIDELNILRASLLAMEKAVFSVPSTPDIVLIDGLFSLTDMPVEQVPISGGDRKSLSIAAASIVAKVTRDEMMRNYDRCFPAYGFSRHKGYPTAEHLSILEQIGVSPIHRMSFGPVARAARGHR